MNDEEPCIVWSSNDYEPRMMFIVWSRSPFPFLPAAAALLSVGRSVRPACSLSCSLAGSLALGIGVEFGVRVKTSLQSPVTSLSERARVFRIEGKEGTDRFSVTQR